MSVPRNGPESSGEAVAATGFWGAVGTPLLAATLAFAFALLCASGLEGLADTDPYRHLEYARQLWQSGFALRGHPFLPFTSLGDSGVDLWWGFHYFLIPFTPLGNLLGARIAGAAVAALTAGTFAGLLRRLGQRHAWLFALAPYALSFTFALRGHVARPAHLTICLLLINLAAGAGLLRPAHAAGASFLHALFHMSSPLSPVFAGFGWLGARLARFLPGAPSAPAGAPTPSRSAPFKTVLWSLGGLLVGLLVRPDRAEYVAVAAFTSLSALGTSGAGKLPHLAPELQAISVPQLFQETWPTLLLVGLAFALGWRRERSGPRAMRAAVLVALGPAALLTLGSWRFLDYLLPLLVMAAALLWPREEGWPRGVRPVVALGAIVLLSVLGYRNASQVWASANRYIDPPRVFEAMAQEVRARVPRGAVLFTDDLFLTAVLYSDLPEYKYVIAYDPSLLYAQRPRLFWRWHHVVDEGINCDEPSCPAARPSPVDVAEVVHSFDSEWIITSYPPGRLSMQLVMSRSPGVFELVARVPGPVTGLSLWHLHLPRPGALFPASP